MLSISAHGTMCLVTKLVNHGPKREVGRSLLFMRTGPMTVNIVLLARNKRTILIQHPILLHFQARKFSSLVKFEIFGFPMISPGLLIFTVSIFSVPFTTRLF